MFERYTDRARRVIVCSQDAARDLKHNYIGTEHLLLGMLLEAEGMAALSLNDVGIAHAETRERVLAVIGEGKNAPSGHIPFTPRLKKVCELALREALQLGCNYIGTEHLLLGLIREGEGVGAGVIAQTVPLDVVRKAVIDRLGAAHKAEQEQRAANQPPTKFRAHQMVAHVLAREVGTVVGVDFGEALVQVEVSEGDQRWWRIENVREVSA